MRRLIPLGLMALALAGCGADGPRNAKVVSPTPETVIGTVAQAPTGSAAGKAIFASKGCAGCHTYKPAGATGKVGPDLDNLAADARKAHKGALADYVKQSIEDPGAYVVPGFPNAMPPFKGQLTDQQLSDLVKFLTTQSS
jgi:mono/diheme cytochrome c family protein